TVTWKWSPVPVRSSTSSSDASGNASARRARIGSVAIPKNLATEHRGKGAEGGADHPLGGEVLRAVPDAPYGGELVGLLDRGRHQPVVLDDDPAAPVLDHLRNGTPVGRDHRCTARHRFDHHEPERLLPLDREKGRARVLEQLDLLAVGDLAEVLD